jgi:hypothetical protein
MRQQVSSASPEGACDGHMLWISEMPAIEPDIAT